MLIVKASIPMCSVPVPDILLGLFPSAIPRFWNGKRGSLPPASCQPVHGIPRASHAFALRPLLSLGRWKGAHTGGLSGLIQSF